MTGRILRFLTPVAVFALFMLVTFVLLRTRPIPDKKPTTSVPPAVEFLTVEIGSQPRFVDGMGSVIPSRTVVIQPEVTGRIIEQSDSLVMGGLFSEGQKMVEIDRRDYKLAVDQQKALVEQSKFELKVEEGRQTVAKREWALLESELESTPEGKALALRKPHLNNAKAVLKAAKSGLAKSKLALDRTTITAPFNALVREESVELGGLVSPQTALASLVGTRQFWVQASVPVQHLGHIGVDAPHKPPAVTLTQATGSTPLTRQGRVLRILGDLDPQGRMARVIIAFMITPNTNIKTAPTTTPIKIRGAPSSDDIVWPDCARAGTTMAAMIPIMPTKNAIGSMIRKLTMNGISPSLRYSTNSLKSKAGTARLSLRTTARKTRVCQPSNTIGPTSGMNIQRVANNRFLPQSGLSKSKRKALIN